MESSWVSELRSAARSIYKQRRRDCFSIDDNLSRYRSRLLPLLAEYFAPQNAVEFQGGPPRDSPITPWWPLTGRGNKPRIFALLLMAEILKNGQDPA